jgi:hypothetical protein
VRAAAAKLRRSRCSCPFSKTAGPVSPFCWPASDGDPRGGRRVHELTYPIEGVRYANMPRRRERRGALEDRCTRQFEDPRDEFRAEECSIGIRGLGVVRDSSGADRAESQAEARHQITLDDCEVIRRIPETASPGKPSPAPSPALPTPNGIRKRRFWVRTVAIMPHRTDGPRTPPGRFRPDAARCDAGWTKRA